MKIDKQKEIIKTLNLNPQVTKKGWHVGKCPYCGKDGKFGVKFNSMYNGRSVSSFNCFSGSCGESGSIIKLLKYIGRLDLIDFTKYTNVFTSIKSNIEEPKKTIDLILPKINPPSRWKRISSHQYLEERGFTSKDFEVDYIGVSDLPEYKDEYIIILCIEEGECKGYLSRSVRSKQWIDDHNEVIKEFNKRYPNEKKQEYLRWKNSSGVDFEKMLFGYDEIKKGLTKTVILVEGYTSKKGVDRNLDLYDRFDIKCCATYGKALKSTQITKLKLKGVENIILLYDPDAINSTKEYSMELEKHFNTTVGVLRDKDPGDMSQDELLNILDNLKSPQEYNRTIVKGKLK